MDNNPSLGSPPTFLENGVPRAPQWTPVAIHDVMVHGYIDKQKRYLPAGIPLSDNVRVWSIFTSTLSKDPVVYRDDEYHSTVWQAFEHMADEMIRGNLYWITLTVKFLLLVEGERSLYEADVMTMNSNGDTVVSPVFIIGDSSQGKGE